MLEAWTLRRDHSRWFNDYLSTIPCGLADALSLQRQGLGCCGQGNSSRKLFGWVHVVRWHSKNAATRIEVERWRTHFLRVGKRRQIVPNPTTHGHLREGPVWALPVTNNIYKLVDDIEMDIHIDSRVLLHFSTIKNVFSGMYPHVATCFRTGVLI